MRNIRLTSSIAIGNRGPGADLGDSTNNEYFSVHSLARSTYKILNYMNNTGQEMF
jgi:hypothetical protein